MKILVVEDEPTLNKIIAKRLKIEAYSVDCAFNGKEALDYLDAAEYDLLIVDIMMPEMNGYETTKAIRNLPDRPDGKEIPIIAMTANAFAEDVQAALKAGMDDHVAKPIDMSILISVITKYIEQ